MLRTYLLTHDLDVALSLSHGVDGVAGVPKSDSHFFLKA